MTGTGFLVLAIVAVTLGLMLVRPRGWSEARITTGGATAILALGVVPLAKIPHLIGETSDVLLFLVGMMLITGVVERAGVFTMLADGCVRLARSHGRILFVNLFLLGALVTTTLSLDVTIIMLTPIVIALTSRHRLDPVPFLFSVVFVANIASLALPVSNLTNLLVYARLGIGFGPYAQVMWLPNLVAAVSTLLILGWIFRNRLPCHLPDRVATEEHAQEFDRRWLMTCGSILAVTLVALFAFGLMDLPLWWATLAGAVILAIFALRRGEYSTTQIWSDLSPGIFVFIVAMTIVVEGFQRSWLDNRSIPLPTNLVTSTLVGVVGGAVGSNVVNNVPMTVLALPLIERAEPAFRLALAYGTLVGVNIGPALTTYGSLATMLWLTLVRRRGIVISTRDYFRVSLITVPIVLALTAISLGFVLR